MSAEGGAVSLDVRTAAGRPQAPPGGALSDAGTARCRALRRRQFAAATRRTRSAGGPAALGGPSLQPRGVGVAREPLAVVRAQPSDAPQPLESDEGLVTEVLQQVDDILVDGELPSGELGLVVSHRITEAVIDGHGLAIPAHDDADVPGRGVGGHPRDRGGLMASMLQVAEEEAEDPGQRALGGASPGTASGDGIDARLAVAEEPAARSREGRGLEDRPSLSPGDISDIPRGCAAGCRDDVPIIIKHNEGPAQALSVRVAVVDPGPITIDSAVE